KAFVLQRIESPVSFVFDGHAFAGMEAARDCNALLVKIDQFLKVRIVSTARPNGRGLSIAFYELAFGISQSSEGRLGEPDEEDQGPPSHDAIESLLLLSDLNDPGKWLSGMGGVLPTIGYSVQIILW